MPRRRFRRLERGTPPAQSGPGPAPATPLFRRALERDAQAPHVAASEATLPVRGAERAAERAATPPPGSASGPAASPAGPRPEDERDAPGFGAVLASGMIAAGIFAMVSIPLRLLFAAGSGAPIAWSRFFELGLALAISAVLYRRYARQLRGL